MSDINNFYKSQTVFLTGATGGLGGCILYKLAILLEVPKMYVLVRQSQDKVLERWALTMPDQVNQYRRLIEQGKIVLVLGDMTKPNFGIESDLLRTMQNTVTTILHTAANISFAALLPVVVRDNCLPALELASIATKMTKLQKFVHVSTAYANSFLPDGSVEEKVYPLSKNPEAELAEILETGKTKYLKQFPWAYAYSKQLAERLLATRYPSLPILIVRPSCIGPAVAQPYPLYGPNGSVPLSTLFGRMMRPSSDASAIYYSPMLGENILDEVPVDVVANVLLRHAHAGTVGVVHASAGCYEPVSVGWMFSQLERTLPSSWYKQIATPVFTMDPKTKVCKEGRFYGVSGRNWHFDTTATKKLEPVTGPLHLDLEEHNVEDFFEYRFKNIFVEQFGQERWNRALQQSQTKARL